MNVLRSSPLSAFAVASALHFFISFKHYDMNALRSSPFLSPAYPGIDISFSSASTDRRAVEQAATAAARRYIDGRSQWRTGAADEREDEGGGGRWRGAFHAPAFASSSSWTWSHSWPVVLFRSAAPASSDRLSPFDG